MKQPPLLGPSEPPGAPAGSPSPSVPCLPGDAGHHEVHLRHDGPPHLPCPEGRRTPGARGEVLPGGRCCLALGGTPACPRQPWATHLPSLGLPTPPEVQLDSPVGRWSLFMEEQPRKPHLRQAGARGLGAAAMLGRLREHFQQLLKGLGTWAALGPTWQQELKALAPTPGAWRPSPSCALLLHLPWVQPGRRGSDGQGRPGRHEPRWTFRKQLGTQASSAVGGAGRTIDTPRAGYRNTWGAGGLPPSRHSSLRLGSRTVPAREQTHLGCGLGFRKWTGTRMGW